MSKEEDVDERQYLYVRKYHKMVKQFDELIEIMDAKATQLKRRRVSSSPRKSRSTSAGGGGSHVAPPPDGRSNSKPAATRQLNNNSILVETITRHLQDLKNENPSDSDSFNPATK
ncbi:uncharacterized protein LOC130764622 [Actinidia eriantha]|uniref:uncharacterized protein LOC130764622 n=1 Tax=Actinidia eriantha TaxID=165200 RepID=UPI00258A406D|nr:uncharacterized protein LOC130764622 [Actinidia eriantha]